MQIPPWGRGSDAALPHLSIIIFIRTKGDNFKSSCCLSASRRSTGGSSSEVSPRSKPSAQPSPTFNLSREYTRAVQANSYRSLLSSIQAQSDIHHQVEEHHQAQLLAGVLYPNRESVQEALGRAQPSTLTRLASDYFENSQRTLHLCLLLLYSVSRARFIYSHLRDILNVLPLDSTLSESQCDSAFEEFVQFDRHDNPFACPDSQNFHHMRGSFSQLKDQLDSRCHKSSSRIRLIHGATTASALCLVAAAVGVAISAVAIAANALVALVAAGPPLLTCPSNITKKELARISQLKVVAKGTTVIKHYLDTIDRLAARLHAAVEDDKILVRLGLERGRDKYFIQEVAKQLSKNHVNVVQQLEGLEQHICFCFTNVNEARSLLLQELHNH